MVTTSMATTDQDALTRGPGAKAWPRETQKRAVLVWISFLVAAVMSLVFFGVFDPERLLEAAALELGEGRETGYALIFFFFWSGTAIAGWLTLRLTRRQRP